MGEMRSFGDTLTALLPCYTKHMTSVILIGGVLPFGEPKRSSDLEKDIRARGGEVLEIGIFIVIPTMATVFGIFSRISLSGQQVSSYLTILAGNLSRRRSGCAGMNLPAFLLESFLKYTE